MTKTEIIKTIIKHAVGSRSESGKEPAEELKKVLSNYFSLPVFPVNSGRSAIYLILKAAGIGEGDEVLIQAYTCNSVPNPVLWTGAKPIYADINPETLNVDIADLKKKLTNKTKAIILQHTFGRPGPIEEVLEIAKQRNLILIEDCAHSFGAEYKGQKLGTFGDAAILSFARGKVLSSISGGAIVVKKNKLQSKIESLVDSLPPTPKGYLFKDFLNFFTWRGILRRIYFNPPAYQIIQFLDKQNFFNPLYSSGEMKGLKPVWHPAKLHPIFAKIALSELPKLEKQNDRRREIADEYCQRIKNQKFRLPPPHNGIYLRVVAFYKNPDEFFKKARKYKLWFGNWYNAAVFPKETHLKEVGYTFGSCPRAEEAAAETINLPNYPEMTAAQLDFAINFINKYDEF